MAEQFVAAPHSPEGRAQGEKQRVALLSILGAVGLVAMKLTVGILTGSLGILAEAAHSTLDLAASVLTLLAVRLAGQPPDAEHRYGHGKAENLAAFVEALLLLLTVVWIAYEAIRRLRAPVVHVEVTLWAVLVMASSIAVDFYPLARPRPGRARAREPGAGGGRPEFPDRHPQLVGRPGRAAGARLRSPDGLGRGGPVAEGRRPGGAGRGRDRPDAGRADAARGGRRAARPRPRGGHRAARDGGGRRAGGARDPAAAAAPLREPGLRGRDGRGAARDHLRRGARDHRGGGGGGPRGHAGRGRRRGGACGAGGGTRRDPRGCDPAAGAPAGAARARRAPAHHRRAPRRRPARRGGPGAHPRRGPRADRPARADGARGQSRVRAHQHAPGGSGDDGRAAGGRDHPADRAGRRRARHRRRGGRRGQLPRGEDLPTPGGGAGVRAGAALLVPGRADRRAGPRPGGGDRASAAHGAARPARGAAPRRAGRARGRRPGAHRPSAPAPHRALTRSSTALPQGRTRHPLVVAGTFADRVRTKRSLVAENASPAGGSSSTGAASGAPSHAVDLAYAGPSVGRAAVMSAMHRRQCRGTSGLSGIGW